MASPTLAPKEGSLAIAFERALTDLASRDAAVFVVVREGSAWSPDAYASRFPDRITRVAGGVEAVAARVRAVAETGGTPYVLDDVGGILRIAQASGDIASGPAAARVRWVGRHGPLGVGPTPDGVARDLGVLRGLSRWSIVVPSDPPTASESAASVSAVDGPAYVRLTTEPLGPLSDGSLTLGKANELRPGCDLSIAAVGGKVTAALGVAEELHRVGIEVRVLDLVSVKPVDAKAILRAARETGAILTMEEHSTLTGVGSLVATIVSEEYPVPVRRVGLPPVDDLDAGSGRALSAGHALDEAWELLRMRGKVH
jgi:transketolase